MPLTEAIADSIRLSVKLLLTTTTIVPGRNLDARDQAVLDL
jgi:hypothetical protein